MFARYKVVSYYDNKSYENKGFVQAHTFTEAVQKIEADFDDIESIEIKWIDEVNNCLDDDVIHEAFGDDEGESGAGHQLYEAIKEGIKEAIEYDGYQREIE